MRAGLEREEALQQGKAQAQVDWQRQCEDLERIQYERSEDLVRRLTKARDEVRLPPVVSPGMRYAYHL